jgi:hypothetical protein
VQQAGNTGGADGSEGRESGSDRDWVYIGSFHSDRI